MSSFYWWFAALAIIAAAFVLWPLVNIARRKSSQSIGDEASARTELNNALYEEQAAELAEQLRHKELNDTQYQVLLKEAEQQRNQDNQQPAAATGNQDTARWPLWITAVTLPLIAALLYWQLGAAQDWQIQQLLLEKNRLQASDAAPREIQPVAQQLFDVLQSRVAQRPENLNNQMVLARTAFELQRYDVAKQAYGQILERFPQSPQVLAELGQVTYIAADYQFNEQVKSLFDRALALAPNNTQVLGLAGFNAYQAQQFELALDYWQRVLQVLPKTDSSYATWQESVAQAKQRLGLPADAPVEPELEGEPWVQVTVQLSDNLPVQPNPEDTVFVYARAWQGPRMPLAMSRLRVADLPSRVRLDTTNAMTQGMTLAQFEQLEVVARVSPTGTATPQSGDWEATLGPVPSEPGQVVEVVIDSRIP